jgi:hypothetical protein
MRRSPLFGLALSMAVASFGGCAGEDAEMTAYVAPAVTTEAPRTFSVFGVFRDGRMSTPAWDELAPKLTLMLGPLALVEPDACKAAYSADLLTESAELATAIDEYSKNYGVTEPLLDRLAPAAKGDLVLVFLVAGSVRSKGHDGSQRPRPAPGPGAVRMRRATTMARGTRPDRGGFEVTATLFSPKEHAMVAAVTLHYNGTSEESAFSRVLTKWAQLFPHVSCAGWDWQAHPVDADTVRALPEP